MHKQLTVIALIGTSLAGALWSLPQREVDYEENEEETSRQVPLNTAQVVEAARVLDAQNVVAANVSFSRQPSAETMWHALVKLLRWQRTVVFACSICHACLEQRRQSRIGTGHRTMMAERQISASLHYFYAFITLSAAISVCERMCSWRGRPTRIESCRWRRPYSWACSTRCRICSAPRNVCETHVIVLTSSRALPCESC